jgi:beta-glucosidase
MQMIRRDMTMDFSRDMTKASEVLAQMTLEEKFDLIVGKEYRWTHGVKRLGVRGLRMADSSMGLRHPDFQGTAFPATIALAATWDESLAHAYGAAVAAESRAGGHDVLLGPGINLYRVANCGRNFEYMGEDPVLAGEMAIHYVKGAQSRGVSATIKHFAANNSDWHRCVSNSIIDERTLREVYLAAFEAVVTRGGVGAVMMSYNLLNGEYTAENRALLRGILQEEWGFKGVVMSDWSGTYNTDPAFDSGLSLEMGIAKVFTRERLLAKVAAGTLDMAELDRKVMTVLAWTFAVDALQAATPHGARRRCPAHLQTALDVARRGTVLLRNEGPVLPLSNTIRTLSVVGPRAFPTPTSGGGSAKVDPVDPRSILGCILEIAPEVQVTRSEETLSQSDAVVVCVGFDSGSEGEGADRPFELPWKQAELIRKCAAANPNTIVVIVAGGGVDMANWIDSVKAVLHAWYPGEIGAMAVAEILFGRCNPSGKLPISIERSWRDAPAYGHYLPDGAHIDPIPDYEGRGRPVFPIRYEEGVFVGYRHYDRNGTAPLFAFGHGLSYTSFTYGGLTMERSDTGVTVSCTVTNSGTVAGGEVVQVYVGDPQCSVARPMRELKGFARVELAAGESRTVRIELPERAFAFYDVAGKRWRIEPGEFVIEVGASSRDIRLTGRMEYTEQQPLKNSK